MMNALVSRMSMDPATSSHFGGNEQFEDTEAEDLMRKRYPICYQVYFLRFHLRRFSIFDAFCSKT